MNPQNIFIICLAICFLVLFRSVIEACIISLIPSSLFYVGYLEALKIKITVFLIVCFIASILLVVRGEYVYSGNKRGIKRV